MSFDHASIDHARNVIRRQVQEEMPELTPIIILHEDGNRANAIARTKAEVSNYFGSDAILEALKPHEKKNHTEFADLVTVEKPIFPMMPKKIYQYALIFINLSQASSTNETRVHMYSMAYSAIHAAREQKTTQSPEVQQSSASLPSHENRQMQAKQNLAAEIFASLMIELQGEHGFIEYIAKQRLKDTLTRCTGAQPELHPFPIVMETLKIIHDELQESFNPKAHLISQALQITEEVIDTHEEDDTIRHWWIFAEAAQEMAWMEFDVETILSIATYTSEDPYIRATAHMVSDYLNITPSAITDLDSYNPFTEPEANMRAHKRACDQIFDSLMPGEYEDYVLTRFSKAIQEQNKSLSEGLPLGWCGVRLDTIIATIDKNQRAGNPPIAHKDIEKIFEEQDKAIPWNTLLKANKMILKEYREHSSLTCEDISSILRRDDAFLPILEIYEKYTPTSRNFIKKPSTHDSSLFGDVQNAENNDDEAVETQSTPVISHRPHIKPSHGLE